ncbi:four helix bundle protein [Candidatus Falkowbacteria bacterium]|nr:four helix bundle protein [Candidatus Falkowbacteria bacterium]
MIEIRNSKQFDLEERTFNFSKQVRSFVKKIPKTLVNIDDLKQLIRSSGSVGANYIEANEALSKKDFLLRIKICRKEAKESRYWLKLIEIFEDKEIEKERRHLENEANELMMIFGSIVRKTE